MNKIKLIVTCNEQHEDYFDASWLYEDAKPPVYFNDFVPLGEIEQDTGLDFGQFVPIYKAFREDCEEAIAIIKVEGQDVRHFEEITNQFNAGSIEEAKKISLKANEYAKKRMELSDKRAGDDATDFFNSLSDLLSKGFDPDEGGFALALSISKGREEKEPPPVLPSIIFPPSSAILRVEGE